MATKAADINRIYFYFIQLRIYLHKIMVDNLLHMRLYTNSINTLKEYYCFLNDHISDREQSFEATKCGDIIICI